jgi:type VI secretion system protein ImpL
VLGDEAAARMDPARAQQDLAERYRKDFIKTWREFLRNTTVIRYGSFQEAASKLTKLTGNRSPLLLALCEVSENTSVEDDAVKKLFVPPQSVTPPGCAALLAGASNAAYTDGLIRLQSILQTLAGDQTNTAYRTQASTVAGEADAEVRRVARSFPPDKDGEVDTNTQALLLKPIEHVKSLLTGLPAQQANGAARSFCTAFNSLMTKYPFQPKGSSEAKLDEVSAVFKPKDGALWKLYEDAGKNILDQQGAEYKPKAVNPTATPEFARFFTRAAAMSNAFFEGGSAMPSFSFSIRAVPNKEVEEVTLKMGASTFNYKGDAPPAQKVTWNSAGPQEIALQGKLTGGGSVGYPTDDAKGVWALSRLFASAANWRITGSTSVVDFPLLGVAGGPVRNTTTQNPIVFHIELDSGAVPMVLRPGSGFACVPLAVR